MTFLYKINKKGATAEGCVTASDEAEAKAKLDAKFPKRRNILCQKNHSQLLV